MNKKNIKFNKEAKNLLLSGAKKISDAVTCTLGPGGRNVVIENEDGSIVSTKDGITVAKSIKLEDPIENIGAQLVKQASNKTAKLAGDGTTTTVLLTYSILENGFETIQDDSYNVVSIKRGIEKASKLVQKELNKLVTPIEPSQLKKVATLSANGDEEIGFLISEAMEKVGIDGVVTVEESKIGETSLEVVEGIQFDKGYKSVYFTTNNNNMSCVLQEPKILIYNGKITQVKDILELLESCSQKDSSLLIIAEDIDGEALSTLVVNKMRGILKVCAVKAPEFGDRRTNLLEDIAIITGGTVVSNEKGMKLDKFNPEWLGSAKVATINNETTTIVDGAGEQSKISERILEIKEQIDNSNSPFEIEKLQERLGKLVGGVAVISVGAATEIEMKEKKDRVDDALHATKAALEEGILPGGGVALYKASNILDKINYEDRDENLGKLILKDACKTPLKKIFSNAGVDFKNLHNKDKLTNGYDIKKLKPQNMIKSGIIDPMKVTRLALENAISVASTLLITESVISPIEEQEKQDNSLLNQFM